MSYSQHDVYSDDPIETIASPAKRKFSTIHAFVLFLVGGTFFVQTTLAANVSLGSGAPVEFGQGILSTAACSGGTNLTITPNSTFTNTSGGGAFFFSSVTVSNVPVSCYGKNFTIRAFGASESTPLALFNTTSTDVGVYNNDGTFEAGAGSAGLTVSSGSGTFTATFTSPVALATTVFRITLESGARSAITYDVGDFGPGGGRIFYKNLAGFDCGPTFSSTGSPSGGKCMYLEVAPNTWITPADATTVLLGNRNDAVQISGVRLDASAVYNSNDIGLGYKNSLALRADSRAITNTGIRFVRDYSGGSLNDWYLPNSTELNILVYWSKGLTPAVNVRSTSTAAIINGNFNTSYYYYSSSQIYNPAAPDTAGGGKYTGLIQSFNNGVSGGNQWSDTGMRVRPIRAF
jgi:hypothetical protein